MSKSTSKLGEYAMNYAMRYIMREAVRPMINYLLPTWKHKAIAAVVLVILSACFGIYKGYV